MGKKKTTNQHAVGGESIKGSPGDVADSNFILLYEKKYEQQPERGPATPSQLRKCRKFF